MIPQPHPTIQDVKKMEDDLKKKSGYSFTRFLPSSDYITSTPAGTIVPAEYSNKDSILTHFTKLPGVHTNTTCKMNAGIIDANQKSNFIQSIKNNSIVKTPGLSFKIVEGYFGDNTQYFQSVALKSGVNPTTGFTSNFTNINTSTNGAIPINNSKQLYSVEWFGYFKPDLDGQWSFATYSDDSSLIWIGDEAVTNYTKSNRSNVVDNGGLHGIRGKKSVRQLKKDEYYPIRIMFGENYGGDQFTFLFWHSSFQNAIADDSSSKKYFFTIDPPPSVYYSVVNNGSNKLDCYIYGKVTDNNVNGINSGTIKQDLQILNKLQGNVESTIVWKALDETNSVNNKYLIPENTLSITPNGEILINTQKGSVRVNEPHNGASFNGKYNMKLLDSGNLVLYKGTTIIWNLFQDSNSSRLLNNESSDPSIQTKVSTNIQNNILPNVIVNNVWIIDVNKKNELNELQKLGRNTSVPYLISPNGKFKLEISEIGNLILKAAFSIPNKLITENNVKTTVSASEANDNYMYLNKVDADPKMNKIYFSKQSDTVMSEVDTKDKYFKYTENSNYSTYDNYQSPNETGSIQTTNEECNKRCTAEEKCKYYYHYTKTDGKSYCQLDSGNNPITFAPIQPGTSASTLYIKEPSVSFGKFSSSASSNYNSVLSDYGNYTKTISNNPLSYNNSSTYIDPEYVKLYEMQRCLFSDPNKPCPRFNWNTQLLEEGFTESMDSVPLETSGVSSAAGTTKTSPHKLSEAEKIEEDYKVTRAAAKAAADELNRLAKLAEEKAAQAAAAAEAERLAKIQAEKDARIANEKIAAAKTETERIAADNKRKLLEEQNAKREADAKAAQEKAAAAKAAADAQIAQAKQVAAKAAADAAAAEARQVAAKAAADAAAAEAKRIAAQAAADAQAKLDAQAAQKRKNEADKKAADEAIQVAQANKIAIQNKTSAIYNGGVKTEGMEGMVQEGFKCSTDVKSAPILMANIITQSGVPMRQGWGGKSSGIVRTSLQRVSLVNGNYLDLGQINTTDNGLSFAFSFRLDDLKPKQWSRFFELSNGVWKDYIFMGIFYNNNKCTIHFCVLNNGIMDAVQIYEQLPYGIKIDDGQFHHMTWTLNKNKEWIIYHNGIEIIKIPSGKYPTPKIRTNSFIGHTVEYGKVNLIPNLSMTIKDFRIYDRVLPKDHIECIYNISISTKQGFKSMEEITPFSQNEGFEAWTRTSPVRDVPQLNSDISKLGRMENDYNTISTRLNTGYIDISNNLSKYNDLSGNLNASSDYYFNGVNTVYDTKGEKTTVHDVVQDDVNTMLLQQNTLYAVGAISCATLLITGLLFGKQ